MSVKILELFQDLQISFLGRLEVAMYYEDFIQISRNVMPHQNARGAHRFFLKYAWLVSHVAARSRAWGLRPLASWNCGVEARREHGCLPLVRVVCCQISLRQADHSSRGVLPSVMCPMSVIAKPRKGMPWPRRGPKRYTNKGFKWLSWLQHFGVRLPLQASSTLLLLVGENKELKLWIIYKRPSTITT